MSDDRYELITSLYNIAIEFKLFTVITDFNHNSVNFIKPGQTHLHYVEQIYKQSETMSAVSILVNLFSDLQKII